MRSGLLVTHRFRVTAGTRYKLPFAAFLHEPIFKTFFNTIINIPQKFRTSHGWQPWCMYCITKSWTFIGSFICPTSLGAYILENTPMRDGFQGRETLRSVRVSVMEWHPSSLSSRWHNCAQANILSTCNVSRTKRIINSRIEWFQ